MDNPETIFQSLEMFSKEKCKEIPPELEEYLSFVAKTGDPIFQWSLVKPFLKEKLLAVLDAFRIDNPSFEVPECPNVEAFNYEQLKDCLLKRLDSFTFAPFTIQRICELLSDPRKEYNRIDKYMRAFEKNVLVVTSRETWLKRSFEVVDTPNDSILNGLLYSKSNAFSYSQYASLDDGDNDYEQNDVDSVEKFQNLWQETSGSYKVNGDSALNANSLLEAKVEFRERTGTSENARICLKFSVNKHSPERNGHEKDGTDSQFSKEDNLNANETSKATIVAALSASDPNEEGDIDYTGKCVVEVVDSVSAGTEIVDSVSTDVEIADFISTDTETLEHLRKKNDCDDGRVLDITTNNLACETLQNEQGLPNADDKSGVIEAENTEVDKEVVEDEGDYENKCSGIQVSEKICSHKKPKLDYCDEQLQKRAMREKVTVGMGEDSEQSCSEVTYETITENYVEDNPEECKLEIVSEDVMPVDDSKEQEMNYLEEENQQTSL